MAASAFTCILETLSKKTILPLHSSQIQHSLMKSLGTQWQQTNNTNQEALVICIIFESILVFLPLVYLVSYLLWCITKCYHVAIKTKVLEWYRIATLHMCRSTQHKYVPLAYMSTAPVNNTDIMTSLGFRMSGQHGTVQANVVWAKILTKENVPVCL